MSYKCLIIDDEPLAINVIKKYLSSLSGFEVAGTFGNALDAFNVLERTQIDLIFLDIQMPELNGVDFLRSLNEKPGIIMTTAYREYAVDGFELDVIDYLVKPITLPRFIKALNKFKDQKKSTNNDNTVQNGQNKAEPEDHLFIKADKRLVKTYFDEILFVESLKDYVRVITESEELITHSNLSNFTLQLPADHFIRIHKSYTVSKNKIRAIEGNLIEIGDRKLPIGRNFQSEVKSNLLNRKPD